MHGGLTTGGEVLPGISVQVIRLTWRAEENLRFGGISASTLRGAMGRSLRPLVCTTGAPRCDGCTVRSGCAYGLVWETAWPPGVEPLKGYATPPAPYGLDPPAAGEIAAGRVFSAELRLFGSARAHALPLLLAAREAGAHGFGGRRVRAPLVRAERLGPGREAVVLYDEAVGLQPAPAGPAERVTPAPRPEDRDVRRVRLHLRTPLDVRVGGRAEDFDPVGLTARAIDRLELLSRLYEGIEPVWSVSRRRTLAAEARVVHADLRARSLRRETHRGGRKRRVALHGLTGTVELEAVHPEVLALWRCAEAIGVGKGTVFGLGRIEVQPLPG